MALLPDLRHLRYVVFRPQITAFERARVPLVLSAAVAAGGWGLAAHWLPCGLSGALAAAAAFWRAGSQQDRQMALVPWGLLLEADGDVQAVRWSGVSALEVHYQTAPSGVVQARIELQALGQHIVGYTSDAVDLGMLAGDLAAVTDASVKSLALDLDDSLGMPEGEPFVARLLEAVRLMKAESRTRLSIPELEYRGNTMPQTAQGRREMADKLRLAGMTLDTNVWGLLALIAGEFSVTEFVPDLGRLENAPHPALAAIARASLVRLGVTAQEPTNEVLSYFVPPDELAQLARWSRERW